MLSFELSAIDVVLVIAVITLLLLHLNKISFNFPSEKYFRKLSRQKSVPKEKTNVKITYAECPRGFGNIKKFGDDNSVSERCLGCYKITECYGEKQS